MDFAGPKSVGEIDVFTLQDNSASPVDPTSGLTFTQSGLTAFEVQYWTGSVKYENSAVPTPQGVDPYTGRVLPNPQSHYPIN